MSEELKKSIRECIDTIEPCEGAEKRMLTAIRQKAAEPAGRKAAGHRFIWTGMTRWAVPAILCLAIAAAAIPRLFAPSPDQEQTAGADEKTWNTADAAPGSEEAADVWNNGAVMTEGKVPGEAPDNALREPTEMQLVNPFVTVESAKAIEAALGIRVDAPQGASNVVYSIMNGRMANIDFETDGHEYTLRAAAGSDDIAGLYGEEIRNQMLDMEDAALSVIRSGGDRCIKIVWFKGEWQFVLSNTDGATEEETAAVYRQLP